MEQLLDFTAGAVSFGFIICALFFLRFWRTTRDSLFLWFAIAFLTLGASQALLTFLAIEEEERSWLYVMRLGAFACIILAAVQKNRQLK